VADGAEPRWYAIVDTAQDELLYDYVQTCAEFQCLISGDVPLELATALPYLLALGEGEPLTEAWRREGMGKNWGIAFESWASIDDLRLHFKKFLSARLPDGTVALFRFYDPRVFCAYMHAADDPQRLSWFRLLRRFSVEGAERMHDFHLDQGQVYDGERILTNSGRE
jgi:hypothetical protein